MTKHEKQPTISELNAEALDALIIRAQEAIDNNLSLSTDDIKLLLNAVLTLATMQERLLNKEVTVHKLRKLLGMVQSSEKLNHLLAEGSASKESTKIKRSRKPKVKKVQEPTKVHHALKDFIKGQSCPACLSGKLYKYEPAQLLRVSGHSPFCSELHLSERLRCNACGQFFTASLPDDVLADGEAGQKYAYSARSLMALQKYFAGAPFYRQESLQDILGLSITASTIFDQCEYLSNDLYPIFKQLLVIAADAHHFYLDDTTHRIIEQEAIQKKKRNSNKLQTRTGLYASGIIASIEQHNIVLFQTNIGHAGEFIDEILKKRKPDKSPPILMSDALPSNNPTGMPALHAACNSHSRRQFVDVIHQFPDEVEWVLQYYKQIWQFEDETIDLAMSPAERLKYHQEHSLPIMNEIRTWGTKHFTDETVEENSSLGKAIAYFNRHFERLILFCKIEGAKIDNNLMEQALKLIVRNRKNAYFYKTPAGAAISDVITSLIATAMQAGINVFDYFNAIQRHSQLVKDQPEKWLPWNYDQ
jgi:transposase